MFHYNVRQRRESHHLISVVRSFGRSVGWRVASFRVRVLLQDARQKTLSTSTLDVVVLCMSRFRVPSIDSAAAAAMIGWSEPTAE